MEIRHRAAIVDNSSFYGIGVEKKQKDNLVSNTGPATSRMRRHWAIQQTTLKNVLAKKRE